MRKLRQSHILKALNEQFGGKFVRSQDDTTSKLLRSMGFTESDYPTLASHLERMHRLGKVVVSWEDGTISSIALPELASTPTDESETLNVPAPKGQKAQLGRVKDGEVRPVATRYASPEAEEIAVGAAKEIATAGSLILEELAVIGHGAMTVQEVSQLVIRYLKQLYTSDAAVQSMVWQVVDWLVENGHMERLPGKETTYRLVEPSPQADENLDERILRLIADMEEMQETEASLRRQLTNVEKERDDRISPEKLNKILDDMTEAKQTISRLNEENGSLKLAQRRTAEAHKKALDTQRSELEQAHASEIAALRKQLEEAQTENRQMQRRLSNSTSGLNDATKAKLRELGY